MEHIAGDAVTDPWTEVCRRVELAEEGLVDPLLTEIRQAVHRAGQRLRDRRFHLAVLGQFKRGKSTLVNALLGQAILPDGLPLWIPEKETPHNRRDVDRVEIEAPAAFLGEGIRLLGTPGIGSTHLHNTEQTHARSNRIADAPHLVGWKPGFAGRHPSPTRPRPPSGRVHAASSRLPSTRAAATAMDSSRRRRLTSASWSWT